MVTTAGDDIRHFLKRMPYTVRVGDLPGGLSEFIDPQAAIDYCATQTPTAANPWTVDIWPGTYTLAAGLTASNYVNLKGIGPPGSVVIEMVDPGAVGRLLTLAHVEIDNITFRIVTPAGANRFLISDNAAACNAVIRECRLEITTPNAAGTYLFSFTAASNIRIEGCYYNIASAGPDTGIYNATAGATIHLQNNNFTLGHVQAMHIRSVVAGNWTGTGNRWAGPAMLFSVTLGNIRLGVNTIACTGGNTVTGGSVTIKQAPLEYHVYYGMVPQHAITAAVADTPAPTATLRYRVVVHSTYYAGTTTMAQYVDMVSILQSGTILRHVSTGNNQATVHMAANSTLKGFTLELDNVGGHTGCDAVKANGINGWVIEDCHAVAINAGGQNIYAFAARGNASGRVRASRSTAAGGASAFYAAILNAGTGQVEVVDCYHLEATHRSIEQTGAGILRVQNFQGWEFAGGQIAGIYVSAGVAYCYSSYFRRIFCSAGRVYLYNCDYERLERSGTGNVVDFSSSPRLYHMHCVIKDWGASIATANIATRTVLGGTVASGGSGQARLRINDNAADVAATENAADAAGASDSSFTPARTPRYVQPINVATWRATTDKFFGLRETLGPAIPVAAEEHAGFVWDGSAGILYAQSSDGAVIEQTDVTANRPAAGITGTYEVVALGSWGALFLLNGVIVATHNTRYPAVALDWQELELSDAGGGATTSDVTLQAGFVEECRA